MEPLLKPLADWVADLAPSSWTKEVDGMLGASLLDWCGAGFAGIGHPLYRRYMAVFESLHLPGCAQDVDGCRVLGDARAWGPVDAAAANAAISHFWEFDDAHRAATMHPGITVIPAVLAISQAVPGLSMDRARAAIVAGYEAGLRVGSYLGKAHYRVFHSTATAGAFGAAAATAHALGLSAEQTLWAFGHAGNQASGLWQFLDDGATDAKFFNPAIAVRNGMTAAFLARAGIAGPTHIFEGPRGLNAAWKPSPGSPDILVPDARDPLRILTTTIKSWPTCGQIHSALDCAQAIARRATWRVEDVEKVTVELPQAALDIAGIHAPRTLTQAKFSSSFCIARVLSGGDLSFEGFDDSVVADPATRELEKRVNVVHQPDFSQRFPQERPARVTIALRQGGGDTETRSFRHGDPEAPWQWNELIERFSGIATLSGLPAEYIDRVVPWCERVGQGGGPDKLFDTRDLFLNGSVLPQRGRG